jgi:hypothetical protein
MADADWSETFRWYPIPYDKTWYGAKNFHKILMHSAKYHANRAIADFTKESGNWQPVSGSRTGAIIPGRASMAGLR